MSEGYSTKWNDYLGGLRPAQRQRLAQVNMPGFAALRATLSGHQAIAFLGAGASAPLYPLWDAVINELLDRARGSMRKKDIDEIRSVARAHPDAAVELVRRGTGDRAYKEILRQIFHVRRDERTGLTWTPVQELIVRSPFAGVVTTNYDPGILNARIVMRPLASSTGFASYTDDDALDRWRTGDVFGDDELPVLFAHGHHNQPDKIVLATTEYRDAYRGKLGRVLQQIFDVQHVVWIGFSFADQRIAAILRTVGDESGSLSDPGQPPRHVAVLGWDPTARRAATPEAMRSVMEIELGCNVVIYPAPGGDHSALTQLLKCFTDPRFRPCSSESERAAIGPTGAEQRPTPTYQAADEAPEQPRPVEVASSQPTDAKRGHPQVIEKWVHGGVPVEIFTGRTEELARLDRWASDAQTRLIGVTAWGGAGKTALVTEWLIRGGGAGRRPVRGVFGWSFYESTSGDLWAQSLLGWVAEEFGVSAEHENLADQVLDVLTRVPLLLMMDGLEVLQEGHAGSQFGSLLDGNLRAILTGLCQLAHGGLVVLTSRFPFADVEQFDGGTARMLDVPPFTPMEGAALLRNSGSWLPEQERIDLVRAVDGHALAVGVLAGALAAHPPVTDLRALRQDLELASRTDERVARVLRFYGDRLSGADRTLLSVVAMFPRSVAVGTILKLGTSETFQRGLHSWTKGNVEQAVRQRLTGLLSWLPDSSVSAHPLVRETFRAPVLSPDSAKMASSSQLEGVPVGEATSREHALTIVESIELLIEADLWSEADELYRVRTKLGEIWKKLPAARLGQRSGAAFVATPDRQVTCGDRLSPQRLSYYLNTAGLFGMYAGDMVGSQPYLEASVVQSRMEKQQEELSVSLGNLAECYIYLGDADGAREAAVEASEIAAGISFPSPELLVADAYLAAALDLAGETQAAEDKFNAVDQKMTATRGTHLYSLWAAWWAELLLRTGRGTSAQSLSELVVWRQRSSLGIARSNRLLGRCDLIGNPGAKQLRSADARLQSAVETFKAGDYLLELAETLPDLAEHRRLTGELDEAERFCTEAIAIASPRHQVPSQATALARRAWIRHDRYVLSRDSQDVERARDDADAALRLATTYRRLPWLELRALEAHAALDTVTRTHHGFNDQAAQLRAKLVPDGLNPDPFPESSQQETDALSRPGHNPPSFRHSHEPTDTGVFTSDEESTSFDPGTLTEEQLEALTSRLRRKPSRRAFGGRRPPFPSVPWREDP